MTHFATADDCGADPFLVSSSSRASPPGRRCARATRRELHAANSAATLREPAAHFDLVRAGVALYGRPFGVTPTSRAAPVLRLTSYVRRGQAAPSGQRGRRAPVADRETVIATVPIGYGDGWRRKCNADGVICGRRFPLVGTVSMERVRSTSAPTAAAWSARTRSC